MLASRRVELLSLALVLAVVVGLGAFFIDRHLDRSFITYRYARNLASGQGLAYNPGEPALSDAVAPFYVAVLAAGGQLTDDLPRLGNLISIAAMAGGALALYWLAHPSGRLVAAAAAVLYAAFPLLWMALGLEAPLWMALGLLAIALHRRGWPVGAAALLGMATLTRPESGALVIVLVVESVVSGRPFKLLPAGVYAAVVAAGLVWVTQSVESGGLLPGLGAAALPPADALAANALAGLGRLGQAVFALSPLWAAALALAAAGAAQLAFRYREADRWALLLAGWAALHLIVLVILGAVVYPWHYAPLVPALAALAALGGGRGLPLPDSPRRAGWSAAPGARWSLAGIGALLVTGAAAGGLIRLAQAEPGQAQAWDALSARPVEAIDAQAGDWLRDNTAPGTRIGATRTGLLGYVSERPLVDYEGTLQPDVAQARERGDSGWWISEYAPDVLALRAAELEALGGYVPARDPWFSATYAEMVRIGPAGEVAILTRTADPPPFTEQIVGMVSFPEGLNLNGIATDFSLSPLEGGRMGRVRLEWLLNSPFDAPPQVVMISIQGRAGTLAALAGQTVDFSTWPARRLITTYHTLDLAPALQPGAYDLAVGVGPDEASLTWRAVARAKIPFPEVDHLGGVSGARSEFGSLALLGYRLAVTPDGLELLLLWQAVSAPLVDYRVFVQVRDAQGAIAIHYEGEPYAGAYPTSIWSVGERVPDTTLLETAGLPPGEYEVVAGLLDPDGSRLLTLDGRDTVLVGRVALGN